MGSCSRNHSLNPFLSIINKKIVYLNYSNQNELCFSDILYPTNNLWYRIHILLHDIMSPYEATFICLSVYLSFFLSFCLSVLSLFLFVYPSLCLLAVCTNARIMTITIDWTLMLTSVALLWSSLDQLKKIGNSI